MASKPTRLVCSRWSPSWTWGIFTLRIVMTRLGHFHRIRISPSHLSLSQSRPQPLASRILLRLPRPCLKASFFLFCCCFWYFLLTNICNESCNVFLSFLNEMKCIITTKCLCRLASIWNLISFSLGWGCWLTQGLGDQVRILKHDFHTNMFLFPVAKTLMEWVILRDRYTRLIR